MKIKDMMSQSVGGGCVSVEPSCVPYVECEHTDRRVKEWLRGGDARERLGGFGERCQIWLRLTKGDSIKCSTLPLHPTGTPIED